MDAGNEKRFFEKKRIMISFNENTDFNYFEIPFILTPIRISIIKKTNKNKCWSGCVGN